MATERFSLKAGDNQMWTVSDAKTGVSIEFREGLFNETQEVGVPDSMQGSDVLKVASIMREIGDWKAQEHADIAFTDNSKRQGITEITKTGASRAGRPAMEGHTRRYIVADDVHEWIMAHGGGKYITETVRTIMAVNSNNK